jgi:hypothetical protein
MTGSDLGAAVGGAILALIAVCCAATAALVVGIIYGVPWLWTLIKPWLHSITG